MKKVWYWVYIRYLATRWVFQVNLGNEVFYKGKKYTVANGTRTGCWRLHDLDNNKDGWVPRSECKLVLSYKNLHRSYKYGVRFYMGYWYDIWCKNGIKQWVRSCNIWPWNPGKRK